MIETRYLSFEGIKTKNELAGDLAEHYDLTTENDEFLDTSNDEEVEDFLRHYDYKLSAYLSNNPVNKVEVELDSNGDVKRFSLEQFKFNLHEVDEGKESTFVFHAIESDLIKIVDIEVSNEDYDTISYQLISFYDNEEFTYFVFNSDESTLLNYNNQPFDEVKKLIKDDFANLDLDTNIKLEVEEVRVKDSLELDMLKMSFVDRGFPKNHFLKTTGKYGCNFFNTNGEEINRSSLSLDEVDVDLLTLLERDSEPYHKPDESVDLKQEQKENRRSRNRLR